jgi:hypothetical protein
VWSNGCACWHVVASVCVCGLSVTADLFVPQLQCETEPSIISKKWRSFCVLIFIQ